MEEGEGEGKEGGGEGLQIHNNELLLIKWSRWGSRMESCS